MGVYASEAPQAEHMQTPTRGSGEVGFPNGTVVDPISVTFLNFFVAMIFTLCSFFKQGFVLNVLFHVSVCLAFSIYVYAHMHAH